jgi:serine-type D-Ala-D-Ala carboxypeptidase (penicillin-binding protein 5/6)
LPHVKRLLLVALAALTLAPAAHAGPPPVTARSYLVLNASTGEVLASRDVHARVPVASITKLMTVLVALGRSDPSKQITVDEDAADVGESTVHLRSGERLSLSDLIEAALIQSANDAADAIADGWGDREAFVAAMNRRALAMNLRDTRFVRPDGLDAPGHVSSAHDVTLLARVVMHRPLVRQIVRQRAATISGGRTLRTWNDLLSTYPGLFGVKTGHTSAAGWSEVAAARRQGVTVYATLLGSPDRYVRNADLARLLDWGFSRYRPAPVVVKGRPYARAELGYGHEPLALVARSPLRPSLRVDFPLVRRVIAVDAASLPVTRGQTLGRVQIFQRGKLVGESALVASRSVARPGPAGRAGWYARRTLHHMWGWVT